MKALLSSFVITLLCTFATAQSPAQNKAKCVEFYKAFNGDIAQFKAANFVTADFVDETIPPDAWTQMGTDGISRFQAALQAYKAAFPDIQWKTTLMVAEGEYVMVYGETSGTFKNDFMGMKATNKTFKIVDVDIVQFNKDGKVVKHWAVQDPMVMWAQLNN